MTMTRHRSSVRRGAIAILVSLVAGLAISATVHAQMPSSAPVELVAVRHVPGGPIEASFRLERAAGVDVKAITALIDGVERRVSKLERVESAPLSVAMAIDTSGSMRGSALASAQAAANAFLERLRPQDRVAIVSFADDPRLLLPFSKDRDAAAAAVARMTADGETALYDAVQFSAALLERVESGPRILVLLSDGNDSSGASAPGRASSLEAIAGVEAVTYAFALGADADTTFISELTRMTGGSHWPVASPDSLGTLFAELGSRLGATHLLTIDVPPLALGDHSLQLEVALDNNSVRVERTFRVTNEGLMDLTLEGASTPGEVVRIRTSFLGGADGLRVEAMVAGQPLTVIPGIPTDVLIDPWLFESGSVLAQVSAHLHEHLVARNELVVPIPRLDAQLEISRVENEADGASRDLVIRWRAQPHVASSIVVRGPNRELARSEEREFRLSVPDSISSIRVELLGTDGRTPVAERVLTLGEGAPTAAAFPVELALVSVAVASGLVIVTMRYRRRRASAGRLTHPIQVVPRRPVAVPDRAARAARAFVTLTDPDGNQRRFELGQRPLTIGSARSSDIVIEANGIRPVHARLSTVGAATYRIHGLGDHRSQPQPYGARGAGDWKRIDAGETITIAGHSLRIDPANVVASGPADLSAAGAP